MRFKTFTAFSAQLILQRLANVDLSTVTLEMLTKQCPEIPVTYLKVMLSELFHRLTDQFRLHLDVFVRFTSFNMNISLSF